MQEAMGTATLRSAIVSPETLISAGIVIAGKSLLVAPAELQVPFFPASMTMLTFVVPFLAFSLGARLGALTLLACAVPRTWRFPRRRH